METLNEILITTTIATNNDRLDFRRRRRRRRRNSLEKENQNYELEREKQQQQQMNKNQIESEKIKFCCNERRKTGKRTFYYSFCNNNNDRIVNKKQKYIFFHNNFASSSLKNSLVLFYLLCIILLNHVILITTTTNAYQQQIQTKPPDFANANGNDDVENNIITLQMNNNNNNNNRDFRWPNKQLNVLVDLKSINETELQKLNAIFDQIEHKSCIKINKLSQNLVNPYDTRNLSEIEKNFIYIFKTTETTTILNSFFYNRQPTIGLSSFGCVRQGRQSMILNDLAFKWPELILRYHVLRSLGIDSIERPDGKLKKLLNFLPLSQKIINNDFFNYDYPINHLNGSSSSSLAASSPTNSLESGFDPKPAYFVYSGLAAAAAATTTNNQQQQQQSTSTKNLLSSRSDYDDRQQILIKSVEYLNEDDLNKLKILYNCTDYKNKLSLKPLNEIDNELLNRDDNGKISNYINSANLLNQNQNQDNNDDDEQKKSFDLLNKSKSDKTIETTEKKAEESLKEILDSFKDKNLFDDKKKNDNLLIDDAAKSIVNYLLSENEDEDEEKALIHHDGNDEKNSITETTTTTTINSQLIDNSFFNESSNNQCKPMESCPIENLINNNTTTTTSSSIYPANTVEERTLNSSFHNNNYQQQQQLDGIKPMMLKLDSFHAQDPQLQLANQMKLSQLNDNNLQTYKLLNTPDSFTNNFQQQQQQQQQPYFQNNNGQMMPQNNFNNNNQKSEMLISFEQSNPNLNGNPVAALATSQVLKLCSCTCQTMMPAIIPPPPPPLTTPFQPQQPTEEPTQQPPTSTTTADTTQQPPYITTTTRMPHWPTFSLDPIPTTTAAPTTEQIPLTTTQTLPSTIIIPTTEIPLPPTITTQAPLPPPPPPPTTTPPPPPPPTTEIENTEEPTAQTETFPPSPSPPPPTTTSMQPPQLSTTTTTTIQPPSLISNACNLVEWVKPNKTVYGSAKIVWDVDRANQNYFICNNLLNGELIPGKTHGFSCKLSNEGKALELHNFNVLTKPENVNLAWVQKDSESFGKTNFPVIGGYSKNQDPYIVSRCLVRDENNDVITLIGYVNSQGVGWFPFDDIQIECGQYDILACVN